MKRNLLSLLTALLMTSALMAQIPQGYYDSATGLSGDALKNALHNIIKGHTEYPYSSTATDVWDILKEADRDPANPANVLCIYSKFSINAASEYNSGDGWNREHVWAKSRGDFGTTLGAGTDLHHLRAADVSTNSARNNRNFDEASIPYVDNGGSFNGPTPSYTSDTEWIWEPPADVKGDVARMLMYMTVRYEGTDGEPDLELQEAYLDKTSTAPGQARLSTLIQWHINDPVDDEERRRNNVVYSYQNNRNPFIDHPEYVCEIYDCGITPPGNSAPVFSSNPVTAATENLAYSYAITATDADGDQMSFSASNLPVWLSLTDHGNGSATLNGTPLSSNVGTTDVSISVSDGQAVTVQNFQLVVSGENSGGNASELFFSEYVEGSSYNKAVEIANFTGVAVNLSDYVIKKQTNGAGDWSSGLVLSGSLAHQDVFVAAHSSAVAEITGQADYTGGVSEMSFNGNDALGLFKNDVLIDIIGNFNGGSSNFAIDQTMRRKSNVSSPNTTYTVSEWDILSKDTFTGLGSHTFDGGGAIADSEAPTIPGNLLVSNITENSFDVSWSASSDNVGVSAYEVYLDNQLTATQAGTSYSFTTLNSGTAYEVKVIAKDEAGNSSLAATIQVTTLSPDTEAPTTPGNFAVSNVQQTSFDVSWSASTDNVAVSAYELYLDDVLVATQTATSYPFSSLTASTTYIVKVLAKDEAGNKSSTTQLSVTTKSAPVSQVLIASDFESGWDAWIDGGSDASRYSGSRSYQGSYSINLQDNSGSKSSMTSPAFDISTYNQIDIEFYYYAYSMENNEDFFVMYYDGSSWHTLATFVSGTDFDNNNYYVATVSFDADQYAFASDAKFRFQCDASSNSDDIYIDLVNITASNSSSKSKFAGNATSAFVKAGFELEPDAEELSIYPNPASDYFNFELVLEEQVDLDITIYDVNGRMVSKVKELNCEGTYTKQVNISDLASGVYIVLVRGEDVHFSKRLIVK